MTTLTSLNEKPSYFRLEWDFTSCCKQWIDFIELNSLQDSEGKLSYRSKTSLGNFKLHKMNHSSFLMAPPKKTFTNDSIKVLSSRYFKALVSLKLKIPITQTITLNPPMSLYRKPSIRLCYRGHWILITQSTETLSWLNPRLSLEARLLFPNYPIENPIPDTHYRVLWKHQMDFPLSACTCKRTTTSTLSINLQLLESLGKFPAPDFHELPFKKQGIFSIPETKLDVPPEALLYTFFNIIHVFHQFYIRRKTTIFTFTYSLVSLIVLVLIYGKNLLPWNTDNTASNFRGNTGLIPI